MVIDNNLMSIILPGRIVEYFPEDQTATVQVCAELITHESNRNQNLTTREPIEGVPVVTPGGGGYHQTFPVKTGDTCILYFSQVGYDHWLFNDDDEAGELEELPETWLSRQFDEDDGFALVGLNTLPRRILEYQEDRAEFRNADRSSRIGILDTGAIEIDTPSLVQATAPEIKEDANFVEMTGSASVGTGATGSFSSGEGKLITVQDGIVIGIS